MSIKTLIIILIVVCVCGGGGYSFRAQPWGIPSGIGGLLVILLVLKLLGII